MLLQAPPPGSPYLGEDGIDWINKLHYVPTDKVEYGSVAKTQEYALAYASLYRLAVALGKTSDAKMLYDRALYYRNVFDPEDRFFRPPQRRRNMGARLQSSARWPWICRRHGLALSVVCPSGPGMVGKAVGRDRFNQRMTEFFDYPAPGWYAQYYNPYNETDMQAPFVFNFSGQPWKTQRVVRRVLQENYSTRRTAFPAMTIAARCHPGRC